MSKTFDLLTSQPHPEPCTAIVAVLNLSLKFSNEPKSFLIASIRAPVLDQDLHLNLKEVNKAQLRNYTQRQMLVVLLLLVDDIRGFIVIKNLTIIFNGVF